MRQRAAPAAQGGDRLDLRFRHVGVEEHVVFPGQLGHVDQEGVAAQERDSRCERRAHPFAVESPVVQHGSGAGKRGLCGRGSHPLQTAAQLLGNSVQQAGNSGPEHPIRQCRRHHRPHARLVVGCRHLADALGRWTRQLQHHVVARRAALADHFRRAEHRAETQVLAGAAADDPGPGVEHHLQGPVAGDALGQGIVAVGMGVDEPGHQQAIVRRYLLRLLRGVQAGRADLSDHAAGDQEVGGARPGRAAVEHRAAADDRERTVSHPPSPRGRRCRRRRRTSRRSRFR